MQVTFFFFTTSQQCRPRREGIKKRREMKQQGEVEEIKAKKKSAKITNQATTG
jgi:hypothetical protein